MVIPSPPIALYSARELCGDVGKKSNNNKELPTLYKPKTLFNLTSFTTTNNPPPLPLVKWKPSINVLTLL